MSAHRLALITPAKNEAENLPVLVQRLAAQTVPIDLWLVVNDGSTDGTQAFLESLPQQGNNIGELVIVNRQDLPRDYALGSKYASVVDCGMAALRDLESARDIAFDFVGILDADCFPEPDFYAELLKGFAALPRLGIASGVLHYRAPGGLQPDRLPLRWPRGGMRLWRRECLAAAPYQVTTSADAVSAARAWLAGWHCQAFPEASATTRELGAKSDPLYYGRSAYRLYMPYWYCLLKCLLLMLRANGSAARNFYQGYRDAARGAGRAPVPAPVARYFQWRVIRNLREQVTVWNNLRLLRRAAQRSGPGPVA
ncbi:glycosyltransferase [bacterium]|nr:glycosyltransferase [bacterium]